MGDEELPEGWTKHFSNTWKKDYWFNAKTGEQRWEPPSKVPPKSTSTSTSSTTSTSTPTPTPKPTPTAASIPTSTTPGTSENKQVSAGTKRPAAGEAQGGGGNETNEGRGKSKVAKLAESKMGGGLGSLLGSIVAEAASVDPAKLAEQRKKRKEAEEARKAEDKEKKENYRRFVQSTLDNFLMFDDVDWYEFQPTDNMYRLIVQDEAEQRGMPVISQGDDGGNKCSIVFKPGKGPNDLETKYLNFGEGSVAEMMARRAAGDTFEKYNTTFSMRDAKFVSKTRVSKAARDQADEDEMDARVVQNREADSDAAAQVAARLKQSKKASVIVFQKEVKETFDDD